MSWMVVMADGVFDVMSSHDAVYRRGSEQNARQHHDRLPGDTTPNARLDTPSRVGDVSSGPRCGLKRTRRPVGEHRIAWVNCAGSGASLSAGLDRWLRRVRVGCRELIGYVRWETSCTDIHQGVY